MTNFLCGEVFVVDVRLVDEEYFDRIGKYMSLREDACDVRDRLERWSNLNYQNYSKRYGENLMTYHIDADSIDFSRVAIPSAVQVVSDISTLYYNCIDYGYQLEPLIMREIADYRDTVVSGDEYPTVSMYSDYVKK